MMDTMFKHQNEKECKCANNQNDPEIGIKCVKISGAGITII